MRVFTITIAGLGLGARPVRYYSGPIAPPPRVDTRTGAEYLDVPGLLPPEEMESHISLAGGIADSPSVTLELRSGVRTPHGGTDPGLLLGRRKPAAFALLLETIPSTADGPASIPIDRSPEVFGPFPIVVHVDSEAFRATGWAGDGTEGDPYRLTGVLRAIWGTVPAAHVVNPLSARRPKVTSHIVHWDTRRVVLEAGELLSGIRVQEPTETLRGFMEKRPAGAQIVSFEVTPLLALLRRNVRVAALTGGFAYGHHYFDGENAISVAVALGFERGDAWFPFKPEAIAPAGGGQIEGPTSGYRLAMDVGLPDGHPRHGGIVARGFTYEPDGFLALPGDGFLIDGPLIFDVDTEDLVESAPAHELHLVDLAPVGDEPTLRRWPDVVFEETAAAWRPGTKDGLAGMWADLALIDGEVGLEMHVWPNAFTGGLQLTLWSHGWWGGGPPPRGIVDGALGSLPPEQRVLTYGLDLSAPGANPRPAALNAPPVERDAAHWWRRERIPRGTDRDGAIPLGGVALGYWEQERYITGNVNFAVPVGGTLALKVQTTPRGGERETLFVDINASFEIDPVEAPGVFAWQMTEPSRRETRPFGDWPGEEATTFEPVVRLRRQRASHALLGFLQSSGGNQALGIFDIHGYGAGILEDEIDTASIAGFGYTLDVWSPLLEAGDTIEDVIWPLLLLNGAALTMAEVDGRSVVRLVPVGDRGELPRTTLTAADWDISEIPEEETPDELINRLVIKTNHDDGGEAQAQFEFEDGESIAGKKRIETEEVDARGLLFRARSDAALQLRDASAGVFSRVADPPMLISAATTGRSIQGHQLGDVVAVTSANIRADDGSFGVTNLRCRIVGRAIKLATDGGRLVLLPFYERARYWSGSATVSEVISATDIGGQTRIVVRTEFNLDSDPIDPLTGEPQLDADAFKALDHGFTCAGADLDNREPMIVESVVAEVVTFTIAEPLAGLDPAVWAVGAVLLPANYPDATERQREGTHWANSAGRLGGLPGEPGVELTE